MKELKKEYKIGLFAIITLVSIYIVINFLKGQDLFNKKNEFYTVFESVDGLTATGPVFIKGLKVGTIDNIKYEQSKDRFIVKFTVSSKYEIGKNSVAELFSSDLLGGKAIRINANAGDTFPAANSGDTLKSETIPDMVSMLTGEILPVKEQISTLITNLNTTVDGINTILDEETRNSLKAAIVSLNATMKNVEGITGELDRSMPEIKSILSSVDSLGRTLQRSSADVEKTMSNLSSISSRIESAGLDGMITEIRQLLASIQDENGTTGKLMKDDMLYNEITSLINNLDSLITRISENPKKYIRISVF